MVVQVSLVKLGARHTGDGLEGAYQRLFQVPSLALLVTLLCVLLAAVGSLRAGCKGTEGLVGFLVATGVYLLLDCLSFFVSILVYRKA